MLLIVFTSRKACSIQIFRSWRCRHGELSQNLEPLEEIQEILEQKGETIKSLKGYDELSYLIPLFLKAIKVNIEIMEDFKDVDIGEKK